MLLSTLLVMLAADPLVLPLSKPDASPDQEKTVVGPNDSERRISNVSRPTLTVHLAGQPNGTAIIVAPGGGFRHLAIDKEGHDVAKWLNSLGVSAFVLKYRAGSDPDREVVIRRAMEDYAVALALVRARAAEWKVDPRKIGLMGFSAGGAIALRAATGPVDSRPSFVAPIYAGGAGEIVAPADAPPAFFAAAHDDPLTPNGSIAAYLAWTKVKRPATLHVFERGGHGFGIRQIGKASDAWPERFREWLTALDGAAEERLARLPIEHYLQGHATGNPEFMRKAFHPEAHVQGHAANGQFVNWPVADYIKRFTGQPAADEAQRSRRIDFLEITGSSAIAKATLQYPTVIFVDYFLLEKLNGEWRIMNKVFSALPK